MSRQMRPRHERPNRSSAAESFSAPRPTQRDFDRTSIPASGGTGRPALSDFSPATKTVPAKMAAWALARLSKSPRSTKRRSNRIFFGAVNLDVCLLDAFDDELREEFERAAAVGWEGSQGRPGLCGQLPRFGSGAVESENFRIRPLAHFFLIADDVEDIVADLEGEADRIAVFGEFLQDCLMDAREDGGGRDGDGEEPGRFQVMHVLQAVLRGGRDNAAGVDELPADHAARPGRRGDLMDAPRHIFRLEIPREGFLGQKLKRERQEAVSRQDGGRLSELFVAGG